MKLQGWRCVLKSQKRIALRYLLHVRPEKRMVFTGFMVAAVAFPTCVLIPGEEVDALFGLKLPKLVCSAFFLAGFGWSIVWFADIRHSKSFFRWNLTRK